VPVVAQISNQTQFYGTTGLIAEGAVLSTSVEPFIPSSIVRSNKNATAFPHDVFFNPTAFIWFWPDESSDAAGLAAVRNAVTAITETAVQEKQNIAQLMQYPNYAIGDFPLEGLYGSNLPRLQKIAKQYDPQGMMRRAGGFKF